MTWTSLQRSLSRILGALLVAGVILTSLHARRVDLWWQLPQGLSILATQHLPTAAPAAFGLPRQPFVDEYSLYEIGLGLLDQLGGLTAITFAFTAIYLAIFWVPLSAARSLRCDLLSAALVALAGIFLLNRYEQRPELFGILLLVLLLALLRRTRDFSFGFLLRIALIFAVWTNVHSSYLIGGVALVLWLIERAWPSLPSGRWSAIHLGLTLAVAGGAVLINPYGLERIAFTFAQEADLGSNLLSREMWPVWDQPPGIIVLLVVTAAALLAAAFSRPRSAPWLLALTGTLLLVTLFQFRHVGFLAASLLFLAADRLRAATNGKWPRAVALALGAGCSALLLFDGLAATNAWRDLTADPDHANAAFAPALVRQLSPGPALCHDAAGSFLTYAAPGHFPLLDRGQGRFDDGTKRFYFFTVEDPRAFARALDELPAVDDVLVTPPVEGWTLALTNRPGWRLAGAEAKGLYFRRLPPPTSSGELGPQTPSDATSRPLALLRDEALREGDIVRAFCFSALFAPPADSLALLDHSNPSAWSEPFFAFTRAWVRTVAPLEMAAFTRAHPQPANTLLREILLAGSREPLPAPGSSSLERLARVLTLVDRNDSADARALLATLPVPKVSPLYYILRSQLEPVAARAEPPAERWQDWNAGGSALFDQVGPELEARAASRVFGSVPR